MGVLTHFYTMSYIDRGCPFVLHAVFIAMENPSVRLMYGVLLLQSQVV